MARKNEQGSGIMMKKHILTILSVAAIMASLAAAANALSAADYTSGLTDADYGDLFRCKKETSTGTYTGAPKTEHYLLKESCAGIPGYTTDSSKEELGYTFKKRAMSSLPLEQLWACEKPEGEGLADLTTSTTSPTSCPNARSLGWVFKNQNNALSSGLKIKALYKCGTGTGTGNPVKPREVSAPQAYSCPPVAWVLADKPQTTPPTPGYGGIVRCKKTTTSLSGTTTTYSYLLKESCEGYVGYVAETFLGDLGYVLTSKTHAKLEQLWACEKPEGGGLADLTTSTTSPTSCLSAKSLGWVFKNQNDAPSGFQVKPLYKCGTGTTGNPVMPREVSAPYSHSCPVVAWVSQNQDQQLPGTATFASSDFIELKECKKTVNGLEVKALGSDLYPGTSCPPGFTVSRSLGYLFRDSTFQKIKSDPLYKDLVSLTTCDKEGDYGRAIIGTGSCIVRYGTGYIPKLIGWLYQNQPTSTPNNAEAVLFCKSHNTRTTAGEITGFEYNYDIGACKPGGIGPERVYIFKSNPATDATPTEATTTAPPPAETDADSCVDDKYSHVLPVTQPDAWNTRTPIAALSSVTEIKQRIVDAEAMVQYLLCRNKCLREKLGDAFINSNCQLTSTSATGSFSRSMPEVQPQPKWWMKWPMTGRIIAFFKGL